MDNRVIHTTSNNPTIVEGSIVFIHIVFVTKNIVSNLDLL